MVKVTEECLQCLRRLVESTAEAATGSRELRERAVREAWGVVEELQSRALSPAHVANRLHPVIKAVCRNPDPFARRKRQEMLTASGLAHAHAPGAGADLRELIGFSAMGNVIDFFKPAEEVEPWLEKTVAFAVDHIEALRERLQRGGPLSLVLLADNAGEVFFDAPLVRRLSGLGHRVFYAVKADAVQNDLTKKDLESWPLDLPGAEVVDTGAATVGLELDGLSGAFRSLYESADLVLAKGMGHFETLAGCGDPRIFFILMAKCPPVARALGIAPGRFAAFFNEGGQDWRKAH